MSTKACEEEFFHDRFELMKKLYINNKFNGRNRFLAINWFLEKIGHYQNNSCQSCIYELLWKTFQEILEIEKQCSGDRILLKSDMVMNILKAVENYPFSCSWASTILFSTATFLQTSAVNATLVTDVDKLLLLLISTLKIMGKIYECHNDDEKSLKEAKDLSNIILDVLENLPSSNEEEKACFLADHLQELAFFIYISECGKEYEYLGEKVTKKMVSILFNLKSKHFETLLTTPDSENQMERPNTFVLDFLFSLQKLLFNEIIAYNSVPVNTSCATLMKKLLSTFLIQNKSSLHSLKVTSLLFAVAGLDVPIVATSNSCCNSLFKEKRSDFSMLGVSNLLEACFSNPQYFISGGVPAGYLKPSDWLKRVSVALLSVKSYTNKTLWLKSLHSLFEISPQIMEDDICLLIENALLNVSLHSIESKREYCKLFDVVLQAHSKLHQIPKFFVKLLLAITECIKDNSGGNILENGQILPEVQQSVAKCIQELPYGQMVELWKIFIETFSTLENMSQVYNVSKGFIFFVAQLYSSFLLHAQLFQANIPTNIYSQFSTLIENTSAEIKKITSSLNETDCKFVPSQRSVLLLCYAVGEVKLAYNAYYGKSDTSEVKCEEIFDFSILHNCLNKEYSSELEKFMGSDDKILSSLVFQLLLQKIKALQFRGSSLHDDISHMRKCISVTLEYLQENYAVESWDMDICTVNDKNYGTVYWIMFLKLSPVLMNHLSSRDFYDFCNTVQNIILQDSSFETGAKSFILTSFKNEYFQESKLFQTAFISAFWKQENLISSKKRSHADMESGQSSLDKIFSLLNRYHSHALKYAERTPKCNKNLGSIWNEIVEMSALMNNILSSESLPKVKLAINRLKDMVELFKCLPLEYLLPGNQMKCIIGFSLILFLIPKSCKPEETFPVFKEICHLLLSIFEGVRSIWLFDFVSSGPYLKYIVNTMELMLIDKYSDNIDWAAHLFELLATLIIRNVKSLSGVERFISMLGDKQEWNRADVITFYALLKKLSQVLPRPHKQEKYKEALIELSSVTVEGFLKRMNQNFKGEIKSSDYSYFIKCYMYAIEITCESRKMKQTRKKCLENLPEFLKNISVVLGNSSVSDVYLLFISKVCKYSYKMSAVLPEDFISLSWKILLTHFEEKRKQMECSCTGQSVVGFNKSSVLNNFCAFCSSIQENCKKSEYTEHFDKNILSPLTLNQAEEESLKTLSVISTPEILSEMFCNLSEAIGVKRKTEKDVFSVQMGILIFQCIIDANNEKCQQPLFNKPIQELLSYLFFTANEACSSIVCQIMIKIPILNFIIFVIKGNKGLPKEMLLQSLHCVAPVSLEVCDDNYLIYVASFNAVWGVVYNLFMHHTSDMLRTPAVLLLYVKELLKSIVKAGEADHLSRCDTDTVQQVQLCAQNMTRLLTVITREKNEFSKLVPYLVTYYVDTVQHITLNLNIKESILLGIYRLLDICSEDSIKMQAVNIDSMSREVYGNLVKSYRQNKQKIFA